MSRILVIAEIAEGSVHDVSLQTLAAAQAAAGSDPVTCLVLGTGISPAAKALYGYGAAEVIVIDDAKLGSYLTTPYRRAVEAYLAANKFDVVLLGSTTAGSDLAPVLAARLGAACVLDGTAVRRDGTRYLVRRIEFDRKVATEYGAAGAQMLVATLKDGVASVPSPYASRTGEVKAFAVSIPDAPARIARRDVVKKTVNLRDARVIVTAGAGIGSRDNFARVQELATLLGGQVGATRAVVDAGWLPADHQIGQTGATVRPDVYIGCGVSGAVQHWVGISDAKKIVAINTDKNAPIMKRAHYRIVGDVNAVVPRLIKVLKT